MPVIKVVAYYTNADVHKEIYAGYAEDNKSDNGQRIHFAIEEPEERKSET
ncbi:MAG: hypothetical protein PHH28_01170 [Desulfuromonadaceae bacterium]|nr:hypothetical protein [Desulfuromonadaceae bacterium]